eukprot:5531451-Amphidinium_carterae.2
MLTRKRSKVRFPRSLVPEKGRILLCSEFLVLTQRKKSPVGVLDLGEDSKEEDKFSVQAEASLAEMPATAIDEKAEGDLQSAQDLG